VLLIGAGLLALLAGLFAFGYARYRSVQRVAASEARKEEQTLPVVNVEQVRRSPGISELLLPGNITPITEASLYARASGYVRKRYVDIGDKVKQGQLLAEIEAPELDQQVVQGRAAVAQAEQQLQQAQAELEDSRTQLELARVTWERYRVLVEHGAISRQDADQQLAAYRSARANVNSAQANVSAADQSLRGSRANLERLTSLQGFERLRAPFDGIVTARTFDIGALISTSGATGNTGVAGGSGELFRVAQIGTLRILINVPQENAPSVRVGQAAKVMVQQFAQPFQGRITRTANSLDQATRTLLTEVQVQNPNHQLLPGMYAQIAISNVRMNPPLLVPGDSLMLGGNGITVATLRDLKKEEAGNYGPGAKRIHIQAIDVGRDYGPQVEVTRGLEGWEYVVVNPGDTVEEGAVVRPVAAARVAGQGGPQRRGPSDKGGPGLTGQMPGAADSGGRGASAKGAGGQRQ
jgi:RND family efflux transporter MFP subunit